MSATNSNGRDTTGDATGESGREPVRVLFVFAWLVVGGEETEVRLLAQHLNPMRHRIEVVACFRKDGMPEQTHAQLEALGVTVDRHPYTLSFEDTVSYLAGKIPAYDVVVSCQNVADVYPALERLHWQPPLIEHGGLVSEAEAGPKHLTARYVGVCRSIRDAAARRMPGREAHALAIPSMVDLAAFNPSGRTMTRRALGIAEDVPLIGWVGRLDAKKRVEDFLDASLLVHRMRPDARFVVIGGPDAFMPDYAEDLGTRAAALGLTGILTFLGDRADVPELLCALDTFVWLSRGEGMPHVIAEAGAAALPVVATADNGTTEQIVDGETGIFVPHENPRAVADAILRLLDDPVLARRLGTALRSKVERDYSVPAVIPVWEHLFDEVVLESRQEASQPTLFRSFFQGGFECSSHRRAHDRKRVDMVAATEHDVRALGDYQTLARHGILTVRDGVRWHLIESSSGRYEWSSLDVQLDAARRSGPGGMQVIWDLLHYGWPDDLDVWGPEFAPRFARFAAASAAYIASRTDSAPFFCPVNEISFFAWSGGDAGYLNPFARGRGHELKVQLARASIAAMEAILVQVPAARFIHAEPAINVVTATDRPWEAPYAEGHRQAQFQAWDMIAGHTWPQIGGRPGLLDVVGLNYYFNNQWVHGSGPIDIGHPLYKPFRYILRETYARYGRPIFVSETGTEGERRANWLRYVAGEVVAARQAGVPVEGICLYPIMDHPGWDDERYCPNGLMTLAREGEERSVNAPLARELARQIALNCDPALPRLF